MTLDWQFGGWLRSLPPAWAWGILAALAAAGAALIIASYCRTLTALSAKARWTLTLLRCAMLIIVLICLANPMRVDRPDNQEKHRRKLAVVLDRSASMEMPDNRRETRLAGSLRLWKPHVGEAGKAFDRIEYFRFGTKLDKSADLQEAEYTPTQGSATHLHESLLKLLDEEPDAIVCLTDGLDTTGSTEETLRAAAQGKGTRLYFAIGQNRLKSPDYLSIREIKIPPSVLRQTEFTPNALVTVTSRESREIPIELWSGEKLLASATLPVRAGLNALNWSPKVLAGEAGPLPLEFRLGEGKTQEVAAGTTQVVARKVVNVLYYQGALQWGYRFLMAALENDASFKVSSILNPALQVRMAMTDGSRRKTLPDLPETAAPLRDFQIVVLAHVFADQLSANQQQALLEYVRGGGGVLFIAPDTNATLRFAGTPLEQMLPVVFETSRTEDQRREDLARFRRQLNQLNQEEAENTDSPVPGENRRQDLPQLQPFAPPAGRTPPLTAQLFDRTPPLFSSHAQIRNVKAAAEILAIHPKEKASDGNGPAVLLARQQFGDGFSAVLATDLLWRWKMALPSTSHAAEKFWQQLILSLASPGGRGLRLIKLTPSAAINQPVQLLVEGGNNPPTLTAVNPAGRKMPVNLTQASESDRGGWEAVFTPDALGRWEVRARDEAGHEARITVGVETRVRTVETNILPPDRERLQELAEATGGALITDQPVFHSPARESPAFAPSHPLWNSPWLIGLLLGLYGTELLTRRLWKLL